MHFWIKINWGKHSREVSLIGLRENTIPQSETKPVLRPLQSTTMVGRKMPLAALEARPETLGLIFKAQKRE